MGNAKLRYDGMFIVITQIQGIHNSHPLIPFSCYPDNLFALSPGNIFIDRVIIIIAPPEVTNIHDFKVKLHKKKRFNVFTENGPKII